jgi:hypothetical protein
MTQPPPAYDPANPLFSPAAAGPSRIDTALLTATDGTKLGLVAIRTTSATVQAVLNGAQLREWADIIGGLADAVGGGKLATATMADVVTLGQPPR